MRRTLLISSLIAAILLFGLFLIIGPNQATAPTPGDDLPNPDPEPRTVTSFEDCVAAGYPVMESYPRQCRTANGSTFVEDIGNELEKTDLIRISSPRPGQEITSPLVIEGEARGHWFFEATFPIALTDWDGLIIAEHYAEAQGEWMTEAFVPFRAVLEFESPYGMQSADFMSRGTLILSKDNPSGLPEHDDALEVPVQFAPLKHSADPLGRACQKTGCSGQICSDEDVATTCEYRDEYACYRDAVCERQADGECGWTQTDELSACLANAT